jgi:hypothetical protein
MALLPCAGPAAVTTQPFRTTAPPAAAHVPGDATSWWLSTEKMTVVTPAQRSLAVTSCQPQPKFELPCLRVSHRKSKVWQLARCRCGRGASDDAG